MRQYEYKVVPAPKRGLKARGVKTSEDRFAHALSTVMNDMAAEGWEYQRTDTLPSEERQGLTGRVTVFQNMLVFRRALAAPAKVAASGAAAMAVEPAQPPKLIEKAPALAVTAQVENTAPIRNGASHDAPDTKGPRLGPAQSEVATQ